MSSAPKSPLVVYAKVERHTEKKHDIYLAMDLKVIEVLLGTPEGDELRVWGDNGILCRPYVMKFPENSEWVFALYRQGTSWVIPGCRENWLRVENGRRAKGNIEGRSVGEIDLNDLAARLRSPLTGGSTGPAEAGR